jgi:excisionase family DNA binding protein
LNQAIDDQQLNDIAPAVLSRRVAAVYLGLGSTVFDALLRYGEIPSFKCGARVLVRRVDLDAWIAMRLVQAAADRNSERAP